MQKRHGQFAHNLISGNDRYGVYLYGDGTTNNVLTGNLIGTDVSGGGNLGNASYGIRIYGASGNTIGRTFGTRLIRARRQER